MFRDRWPTFASFSLELGSSNCLMDNSREEKELCARCTIIQFDFAQMVDKRERCVTYKSFTNHFLMMFSLWVIFLCNRWNRNHQSFLEGLRIKKSLTISTHANGDTLLESAILAAIAIHTLDHTLLVLRARPVLDLLLDGATEEALQVVIEEKYFKYLFTFVFFADARKNFEWRERRKENQQKRFCKNFTFHISFAFWAVKINKRKRVGSIS